MVSGKLSLLAVFGNRPFDLAEHGEIPEMTRALPETSKDACRGLIGFAIPADVPAAIFTTIGKALDLAMTDERPKSLARKHRLLLIGTRGAEAGREAGAHAEIKMAQRKALMDSVKAGTAFGSSISPPSPRRTLRRPTRFALKNLLFNP